MAAHTGPLPPTLPTRPPMTEWAIGRWRSTCGACEQVLLARADGVPLLAGDWAALCEYVRYMELDAAHTHTHIYIYI